MRSSAQDALLKIRDLAREKIREDFGRSHRRGLRVAARGSRRFSGGNAREAAGGYGERDEYRALLYVRPAWALTWRCKSSAGPGRGNR